MPRSRATRRAGRSAAAFVSLFVSVNVVLLLVVGAFSSTEFGVGFLHDRYLFYVVPLWLVSTAWWAARRVPLRSVALAVGALLVLALLATLPPYLLNDDGGRRFDAIAAGLPSKLAASRAGLAEPRRWSLLAAAVAAVALVVALARLPRWLVLVPVAVVFALDAASRWDSRIDVARNVTFAPMDADATAWVDRAVPDEHGRDPLGGRSRRDPRRPRLTEFFNASIGPAYDLAGGYAPTLASTPVRVAALGRSTTGRGRSRPTGSSRRARSSSWATCAAEGTVAGLRLWRVPGRYASRRGRFREAVATPAVDGATELAGTRRGAAMLVAAALVVFAVQSLGWPMAPGRDLAAYLVVYVDFWNTDPVFPWAMVTRTPVTPLVVGGILDLGSPVVVEVFAALLFAGTILLYARTALLFGRGPAALVGVALLLYPGYGIVFHELAGEIVFAAAFAIWTAIVVEAALRPSVGGSPPLGAATALLALIRPANQAFLVVALLPLLLAGSWRARARRTVAFGGVAVALLAAWSTVNLVRYDDFTVARGAQASLPLFRAFTVDHIVDPENGPASRQLADAVERHLLDEEPYRSYGIDLETFFREGARGCTRT